MDDDGDDSWLEGRIIAFTRGGAREVHNSSQTLLPNFVAIGTDMESLEAGDMTFSEVESMYTYPDPFLDPMGRRNVHESRLGCRQVLLGS